jgi:hypothetical protein
VAGRNIGRLHFRETFFIKTRCLTALFNKEACILTSKRGGFYEKSTVRSECCDDVAGHERLRQLPGRRQAENRSSCQPELSLRQYPLNTASTEEIKARFRPQSTNGEAGTNPARVDSPGFFISSDAEVGAGATQLFLDTSSAKGNITPR